MRLLLLCGSARRGSVNQAVLETVAALGRPGVSLAFFEGMGALPHFNPDDDVEGAVLHPAVEALRSAVGGADAVLVCTPEYAGALPGAFKNLLEWTVGGGQFDGRAVGAINASTGPTGARDAHASLRTVLGWIGARIVEDAWVHVPVPRREVVDGVVVDPVLRERIGAAVDALAAGYAVSR